MTMKIVKQKRYLSSAVVGLILCCCMGFVQAQTTEQVMICHNGHALSVSENALNNHLLHGDIIGPCCIDPHLIKSKCYCPTISDPVCSCNGVTYSNECLAKCAGVLTYTKGPCDLCQGEPKLNFCSTQYDPVCGCDGNTYSNACFAEAAGIRRFTVGTCADKAAAEVESPATLSPNPTNGIAILRWTPMEEGYARITVADVKGNTVFQSELMKEVVGGMNTYPINATGWRSGVYIVKLSRAGAVTTQRLMVPR